MADRYRATRSSVVSGPHGMVDNLSVMSGSSTTTQRPVLIDGEIFLFEFFALQKRALEDALQIRARNSAVRTAALSRGPVFDLFPKLTGR